MEREADEPGSFEVGKQALGQREAVGVDDRLEAEGGDRGDDLDDLRMKQRLTSGDRDAVDRAQPHEHVQIRAHLRERLVALRIVLPVAAQTGEVAFPRRLQPRDGVVGKGPGKPIQLTVIEDSIHVRTPSGSGG